MLGKQVVKDSILTGLKGGILLLSPLALAPVFPSFAYWYHSLLTNIFTQTNAQIFLSVILVLVTAIYTEEASNQTEQMKADRKERFKPIIQPTITNITAVHHGFAVENSGEGAAYDVKAEWWVSGDEEREPVKWKVPLLSSGERRRFSLPTRDGVKTVSEIRQEYGEEDILNFRASFSDGLGNRYTPENSPEITTAKIALTDTIASRGEAGQYVDEDPLSEISEQLAEIESTLDENPPRGQPHAQVRGREAGTILSLLEELGPLTGEQLLNYSGIERSRLNDSISRLSSLGLVDYDETISLNSDEALETEYSRSEWNH